MKQAFKEWRPQSDSYDRIETCNQIINDYMTQGYRLTLRQLYYQLVSRNIIANSDREYKNLGGIVSRARLAGMMDWEAIEDRVRQPDSPPEYDSLEELIEAALYSYRLPRLHGQDTYCELWVEKDALAGVLRPIARKYHATLMVNRGYSSQSAMYESAKRIADNLVKCGAHDAFIFYLGDLDPSGEDMVRDIQDRMHMFHIDVQVKKIALTMDQVKQYNPPPNPAKLSDSRAKAFIEKYGRSSWEVDALPPPVLNQIIEAEFQRHLDLSKMEGVRRLEDEEKVLLKGAVEKLLDGRAGLPMVESAGSIFRCPGCFETFQDRDEVEFCAYTEDCPGWED